MNHVLVGAYFVVLGVLLMSNPEYEAFNNALAVVKPVPPALLLFPDVVVSQYELVTVSSFTPTIVTLI